MKDRNYSASGQPGLAASSYNQSMSSRRQVKKCFLICKSSVCSKAIMVCLMWELTTGFCFNLLLIPTSYVEYVGTGSVIGLTGALALIFLLSPLAGFIADTKFGRYNMLLRSSYLMLGSVVCLVFNLVLLAFTFHHNVNYYIIMLSSLFLIIILYSCGRMLFIANFLQFVMDQLRDAPTKDSVLFLYVHYWSNSFSAAVASCTRIPGHTIDVNIEQNHLHTAVFDRIKVGLLLGLLNTSVVTIIIILCFLHTNKDRLVTDIIVGNPYKLVYQVIHFACQNKKPLRRSAFTYCEDERLSRLDYGKQRYGGPFTTEQVENVKVLLHMLKVLLSLGPAFLLHVAVIITILMQGQASVKNITVSSLILLHYGALSPLLTLVFIPICLMIKHYYPQCNLNMFKRMGLGYLLLCISILLLLAYDIFSVSNSIELGEFYKDCKDVNATYIINNNVLIVPTSYMLIIQHTLSAIHQSLIYIAAWEFICSQSPQHMKGVIFGLFYAIRAFYQCIAIVFILPFFYNGRSQVMGCRSSYYMLMLGIGVLSMIVYGVVAKKYKYRKRDDICNFYQYAENYYSID